MLNVHVSMGHSNGGNKWPFSGLSALKKNSIQTNDFLIIYVGRMQKMIRDGMRPTRGLMGAN